MSTPLWSLEVDHTAPATYLADQEFLIAMAKGGLSPATFRTAVAERFSKIPLTLDLVKPDGEALYEKPIPVGDMLLFGWLPVFSERAYELLLSAGSKAEEFIECRLRVLGSAAFLIHAPLQSFDVIDLARSVAMHSLPVNPPIPFHFVSAHLKPCQETLPPCFRVPAPGHPQVLAELFAQDNLQSAWASASLKGANFRRLSHGAA
jgi:hypothetical protein